jgi:phage tail-like protein
VISGLRQYRFQTAEQWQSCLLHRFEAGTSGVDPVSRLGLAAQLVSTVTACDQLALAPDGAAIWRQQQGEVTFLWRRGDDGALRGPFEPSSLLARSPRLVNDGRYLWAFDAGRSVIAAFDAETLEEQAAFGVTVDPEFAAVSAQILDLSSDGQHGVWVLLQVEERYWLARYCNGKRLAELLVPPQVKSPTRFASTLRGRRLTLLTESGAALVMLDPLSGKLARKLAVGGLALGVTAAGISSDGRNRIAVWGNVGASPAANTATWRLLLLDGSGDSIDTLADEQWAALPALRDLPLAVAVGANLLQLATTSGVYVLDTAQGSKPRETESTLITPALQSPRVDAEGGWLRAEIDVELARGSELVVEVATSDDALQAARLRLVAANTSLSSQARQAALDAELDFGTCPVYRVSGPRDPSSKIMIPILEPHDAWVWLRLRVLTPPAAEPSALRALRVVYPADSIARHLPAMFFSEPGISDSNRRTQASFMRRLVGVLECTTQDLDQRILGIAGHIDPSSAPASWLSYLASWLDLPWDDALPIAAQRRLLLQAGQLLAQRGTRLGLTRLLECLLGQDGRASVRDVTVDSTEARVGGKGCRGAALPALLGGMRAGYPELGGKAVLGLLRLPCRNTLARDPLAVLQPTVVIRLTLASKSIDVDVIKRVVAAYVPIGVGLVWRVTWGAVSPDGDTWVLEGDEPRPLGARSRLGGFVVAGTHGARVGDPGAGLDLRLR